MEGARETLKREIELSAFFRPSYARRCGAKSAVPSRDTQIAKKSLLCTFRFHSYLPPSFSRELRITAGSSATSKGGKFSSGVN